MSVDPFWEEATMRLTHLPEDEAQAYLNSFDNNTRASLELCVMAAAADVRLDDLGLPQKPGYYSLHLFYKNEPDDRPFLIIIDPVPDLNTALRLSWYHLAEWHGDYGLLYFEHDSGVMDDEKVWTFKPRYRVTAPVTGDHQGTQETL